MRVTLETHGGLAAGIRRPPRELDAAGLSPQAAAELARRVEAARAAPPPGTDPSPIRDAVTYTITLQDEGERTVLEQSDGAMSPRFAALLDWLERSLPA
jgi:hypothetical protein